MASAVFESYKYFFEKRGFGNSGCSVSSWPPPKVQEVPSSAIASVGLVLICVDII